MPNQSLLIPLDMADVFEALSQDCGLLQREQIAAKVDGALDQRQTGFELRSEVRHAVEVGNVELLPDSFTHPKLWAALKSAFKDCVISLAGLPAPLIHAINHLSR